jgi:hypothetical protein
MSAAMTTMIVITIRSSRRLNAETFRLRWSSTGEVEAVDLASAPRATASFHSTSTFHFNFFKV